MSGISVFDSSAIIKFLNNADDFIDLTPFFVQNVCFVSVITKLEVLGWPDITTAEETRITKFFSSLTVLPIDSRIETETIKIRWEFKTTEPLLYPVYQGRKKPIC
jgi:hypothetical protein